MQESMKPTPPAATTGVLSADTSGVPTSTAPTIGCCSNVTCGSESSKADDADDAGDADSDVMDVRTKRFAAVCIDGQSHSMHHAPLPHHQHHLCRGWEEKDAAMDGADGADGGEIDGLSATTEARSPKRTASDAGELGSLSGCADECDHPGCISYRGGDASICSHHDHSHSIGSDDDVAVGLCTKRANHRPFGSDSVLHVAFDEPLVASIHSTWPAEEYERALQPSDQYVCKACGYFTDIVHYRCRTCADYDLCPPCYETIYDEHKLEPKCQHPKSCFMYMCDGLD